MDVDIRPPKVQMVPQRAVHPCVFMQFDALGIRPSHHPARDLRPVGPRLRAGRQSISLVPRPAHRSGWRTPTKLHEREATAKSMLYSYRVALTGVHLLRSALLEPNLTVLAPAFGYHDVADLVALKQAGTEHGPLPDDLDQHHRGRCPELEQALVDAEAASSLPAEAPNTSEIEAWLISMRLTAFMSSS